MPTVERRSHALTIFYRKELFRAGAVLCPNFAARPDRAVVVPVFGVCAMRYELEGRRSRKLEQGGQLDRGSTE